MHNQNQNSFSQTLVVDNVVDDVPQSCRDIIAEHPGKHFSPPSSGI